MVKNLLSLLTRRQTSILSGAAIMIAMTMFSKILGLVRDRLLAHIFPPDTVAIFFASFQIPDLLFQTLVFGALSVAFIPVFIEYRDGKGKDEAFELAQSLLTLCLVVIILASAISLIFLDPLIKIVAPGFNDSQRLLIASLTRIILISQIILTFGSLLLGMLHSFQRFIIPALAGFFYNLGAILGILLFYKSFGILAPALGVVIGALLHLLIQLPLALSFGFNPFSIKKIFHPGIKEIFKLVGIRNIGLVAEAINEKFSFAMASLVSVPSATYLTYAQHLQVVPIGLFGATIAQAALPVLSSERSRGRMEEFKTTLLTTIHQILFLVLPAAAILIVLRVPSVRLVFGASQFDWEATVLTAKTLAWLSVGLAAQSVSLLLVRGFYALKDTKTPVVISLIVVTINILLSLYFIQVLKLEVWSIGVALSISNLLSVGLLFWWLHLKVGGFDIKMALSPFFKMLMATVIMGVALYIPVKLLDQVIFDTTRTINLIILTGMASVFALSVYVLLVWYMKVRELNTFVELLKKFANFQTKVKSEELVKEAGTV